MFRVSTVEECWETVVMIYRYCTKILTAYKADISQSVVSKTYFDFCLVIFLFNIKWNNMAFLNWCQYKNVSFELKMTWISYLRVSNKFSFLFLDIVRKNISLDIYKIQDSCVKCCWDKWFEYSHLLNTSQCSLFPNQLY